MNSNQEAHLSILTACFATGLAGLIAGGMSFVSFVDVRSFLQHVDSNNTETAKSHFQKWWPCGRDYMVPLLGTTMLAHLVAWFQTGDLTWLASGGTLVIIGPYTKLVLGEDIEKLRKSSSDEVATTARRFCNLHHIRLVLAVTGYSVSLMGMGNQFQKK